ncbi:MAG TPA: ATP-binding protein [Chloroflexota bacterium]|nr:ATP-binding protein [Chloroflexota bacterium]
MTGWNRIAAVVAACYLAGLALSLLLFAFWLQAPRSHVIAALEYLGGTGIVSLLIGLAALVVAARWAPSLGIKIAVASLFGSAIAILNVVVTPLLMFSETADRHILVITLLYFFILSLAFAALVASITTRQLKALHEGAGRVAAGGLGSVVPIDGQDEVADLSRAFNAMSEELSRSFERQRRLEGERRAVVAAVSHDLRTPLTAIRAMVEAMTDGIVADQETQRRYLLAIGQQVRQLGELVDDLFEMARIEAGNLELRPERVSAKELIGETVAGLEARIAERGVRLELACSPDVPALFVDGPRMRRVLVNLIQNALQHTPSGGTIWVELGVCNGRVEFAVEDSGSGVVPEDRERIFQRFYRGEKSRSRDTGGAGLGLAIALGIVEAHGGTLSLEKGTGPGARFVIRLPSTSRNISVRSLITA